MKPCTKCKTPKDLSEFGKDSRNNDGHQSCCYACYSKYKKQNKSRISAYQKEYDSRPHVIEARKARASTKEARLSIAKSNKKTRSKYPNAARARQTLNNAINAGYISRGEECEECQSTKHIQGHHDDYNKPLEVRWLCTKCHHLWHKTNTPLNRK